MKKVVRKRQPRVDRLDLQEWYNKITDEVQCLHCKKWFKAINGMHLKTHLFESVREYREYYGILPRTPLVNKALMQLKSEYAKKYREEGKFKKNEKGKIPKGLKRYAKGDTAKLWDSKSDGAKRQQKATKKKLTGLKRTPEQNEANRQRQLASPNRYLLKEKGFAYKKGHKTHSKGKTYEEMYGEKNAKKIKKKIVDGRDRDEWRKNVSKAHTGDTTGMVLVDGLWKVKCKCAGCGKIFYVSKSRVCKFHSLTCANKNQHLFKKRIQ